MAPAIAALVGEYQSFVAQVVGSGQVGSLASTGAAREPDPAPPRAHKLLSTRREYITLPVVNKK